MRCKNITKIVTIKMTDTAFIDNEINRLKAIKEEKMENYRLLKVMIELTDTAMVDENKKDEYYNGYEYYKTTITFLDRKMECFNYLKRKEFPKNYIDIMNEALLEFQMAAWAYLGMKDHQKEAASAKHEFEFLKLMITSFPVIQDKKKPTRRGGKKHRKNKN